MLDSSYLKTPPKAILFDWDNTLVDTIHANYEAMSITLEALGYERWSFDTFKNSPPHSLRTSFPKLFGDHWEKAEKIFYEAFSKNHLEFLEPFEGVLSLLSSLEKTGIYLGIVSNKTGNYLRKEVGHLGWSPYFSRIVGARDTHEDKPSIIPVAYALEPSSIPMGPNVWFVGDSPVDAACAKASGCIPIIIGSEFSDNDKDVIRLKNIFSLEKLLSQI